MNVKSVTLIAFGSFALLNSGLDTARDRSLAHQYAEVAELSQHPSEPGHAGPRGFKSEFENEAVQVVRVTIGPHEKLPMHDLTPRVVILLTDQNLKVTFPNGETREEHHKTGEAMWVAGQRHAGENLSDKPIEFIAVIPKQK